MNETIGLKSGSKIPSIGMGLWKVSNEEVPQVVVNAAECGYRHFDSACDYGNEESVGLGLQEVFNSGICSREDLWITSKLWNTYHQAEHVKPALKKTLHDLKLDYLDLYLIHFPISQKYVPIEERYPPEWFFDPDAENPKIELEQVPVNETWQAMEELVKEGLVKEIGVCNFGCSLLRDLMANATIPPAVLQVELHPYLTQEKLLRFCRESGITVTGFSPLGALSYFSIGMAEKNESIIEQSIVKEIAERHQRTPAQIVLRWGIQRGTAIVPKTVNIDRMKENRAIYEFELAQEDMAALSGLNQNRRFNDPGDFCEAAFNTFMPIYE